MRTRLNIRSKILVFILGSSVLIFAIVLYFITSSSRRISYDQAIKLTDNYAKQNALRIESWLNEDFAVTRTLAAAFMEYKQFPFDRWQKLIYPMYNRVIKTTPQIDAFWDSWELSNLDSTWKKDHGRYFYIVYKHNNQYLTKSEIRSLVSDPPTYGSMKKAACELVNEPYISELQGGQMMTTLTSPFIQDGKFIGLVGADLVLTRFQELINSIKPYPNSYAFMISNQGSFIAHPDTSIFKKNIIDCMPELNEKFKILEQVQKGKQFSFTTVKNGKDTYYSVYPVRIGKTTTPWAVGIVVPINDILSQSNKNFNISLIISISGIILLLIIIFLVSNNITAPIKNVTKLLHYLSLGRIDKSMIIESKTNDEIGQMTVALSSSIKGIMGKTDFAREIGNGNLEAEVELLSDEDLLGKSLLEMRDNLRKAREEEEKRKQEDEKKKWTNEGLAKFGDILRRNNDNINLLSDEIIKNLVWYLNAQVGGLFILNEDKENNEKTFDLTATFAYDRKRILNKSYHFAEGLIGACAAERNAIVLSEIPQEYIEITSGLGETNPNFLILIPLINEDEVMGVMEIASLKKFKDFEIEFLKDLAKSIASTLHTVKVNSLTAELLTKSKEQAEMMAAQEEEMRQNLEELQATQEEASRKSYELEVLIKALNASSYMVEYDTKGYVTSVNDSYLDLLGVQREDFIGTHHTDGLVMTDQDKNSYEKFWKELINGKIKKRKTKLNINGKDIVLVETYTPVTDAMGNIIKILKIATDITNI